MDIRSVKDIGGLLDYLQEYAGWNVSESGCEDIAEYMYDYAPEELGLKPEECAKISSLKQLPSLEEGQRWGIFSVDFATARLSVTALRKILAHLIPTRRNAADHAVWDAKDLLFFCFWGSGADRTICTAYFQEQEEGLSQIRCFYCAPNREASLQLVKFEHNLRQLRWSKSANWRMAFECYYGEVIKTSSELAQGLAQVATEIKKRILDALEVESERGFVHRLCEKVRRELIHQLTPEEFADMYAQTIVYGLFSARCMDETPDDFSAEEAIGLIPNTNPFLKSMMRDCFQKGGHRGFGFDELGVGDVVELLSRVKNAKVIAAHFGSMTRCGREDPVIHFYEEFLSAYDKAQKVERGVFYTPKPVVGFTVRAVDYILKTTFGLKDGLACDEKIEVPEKPRSKKTKKVHRVQLLDPATGTGTYVMETILQIYTNFKAKHGGLSEKALHDEWNEYVDNHILPRLNAFELMMAPYAVAHVKLAMVLKDTGYDFKGENRLKVFLTNTLEEPGAAERQMSLFDEDPLAAESVAANAAKKNECINIVIGNPPYSGESKNKGRWIMKLMEDYKVEPGGKIKLKERNPKWVNDDYVKFIRYGQERIHQAGCGVLAYINPHGFIDNPTFRGVRWSLLKEFDEIYILNLHGNSNKDETCPDGGKDVNVFDIKQGVSINIFVKYGQVGRHAGEVASSGEEGSSETKNAALGGDGFATIHYADLYGSRTSKYDKLDSLSLSQVEWATFVPQDSLCLFKSFGLNNDERSECFSITDLFLESSTGVLTANDEMNISFSSQEQRKKLRDIEIMSEHEWRKAYGRPHDARDWIYREARIDAANPAMKIVPISYRPYDIRYTGYTGKSKGVYTNPRYSLMRHIIGFENVSMLTCRQVVGDWSHIAAAREIVDDCRISNKTKERGYVFPLYLYETKVDPPTRRVNFDAPIYRKICKAAGIKFSDADLQATVSKSFPETPQLVFDYIYGVLHSGKYRKKYAEFLKIDFPRIPYPRNGEEFRKMAAFGANLRGIHCMEDFDEAAEVKLVGEGKLIVKPVWKDGCVFIDKEVRFTNVPEDLWNLNIGGYQPLQKWLKDRKDRELSDEDISHYRRMVRAIARTRDIMTEIDRAYDV